MVAYSFQKQFVDPILAGTKRQTIRAARRRHARAGEQLQLYTGMRTRHCRLIGTAVCSSVLPVRLKLWRRGPLVEFGGLLIDQPADLDDFAKGDGFSDWAGLVAFWSAHHPITLGVFNGTVISWGHLQRQPEAANAA